MRINCFKCQYFKVTWDPNHPRACQAYGFKTKELPSIFVKKTSGMECMHFTPKQEAKR